MKIAYLTGRHHQTRAATIASLTRYGFPHDGSLSRLFTKPKLEMNDALFKKAALSEISVMGSIVLFLDNEPTNINIFADSHPDSMVVFVETDHSFAPVVPYSRLPRIASFWRTTYPKND